MDESRKQFQSWFEEWFGEPPLTPWNELWCHDGYSAEDIDHMWDAWQASRAAIEIELPAKNDISSDDYPIPDLVDWDDGRNAGIQKCAEAIRAAGIKVKE
ncbi:hypothetical protein GTT80_004330 [Salmonella enterica]|uniref:hypothetical protein n=1 Tax=Salmonella enterica TaxID=28901 RepID=UPI000FA75372|nr:hypothetical protein [Salmonella enterica]EBP4009674.1 hypothetical protein [Salmonella enterica subsp. enterica]EBZ3272938.1 hypothetical protein [Salmonella enterica subsp. enterica serovar Anatum]EDQ2035413.1 hypothetical protein [Salmonella enterica subsp. enterica serovar Meleagridis]EDQ6811776.1 hypothetical protein [Salmonella enterica subsp. enterica serovar 4,[5],12:i:-]EDY0927887.1 hypothetical protein [Salmonella enterica subsp. enterica serovar Havana]